MALSLLLDTTQGCTSFVGRTSQTGVLRTFTIGADKEFTDRFVTTGERTPTGQHAFDELCAALGIEHRLTRPRRPQTNGMVERFNCRIEEVLRSHHFLSGQDLEQTLLRYAWLYNHHLPQTALDARTPMQAMKDWYRRRSDLFQKRPHNHPGHDTYSSSEKLACIVKCLSNVSTSIVACQG